MIFIGIDGGGTKTELVAVNEQGEILQRLKGGCSNPNDIGLENALNTFVSLLESVNTQGQEVSIFIGGAGCGVGDNAKKIEEYLSVLYQNVKVGSDIINAVEVGLEKEDGIVIIGGTGSCVAVCQGGTITKLGGNGYLFEEGGSGYTVGRDGCIAALNAIDGFGESTVLTQLFADKLGGDLKNNLGEFYKKGKQYIASFAPLVTQGYLMGDRICKRIVKNNCDCVIRYIKRAQKRLKGEKTVAFVGGLFKESVYQQYLRERINDELKLRFISTPPVYGAIRKSFQCFNQEIPKNIKEK